MTVIESETQNEIFELPIFYNEKKRIVKENIRKDLEFIHTENEQLVSKQKEKEEEKEDVEEEEKEEKEQEKPIYHHVFNLDVTTKNSKNEYKNKMVEKMSKYYTTDISFLKDYQKLLKKYKPFKEYERKEDFNLSSMVDTWREIKNDNGFKEKYFYIDWPIWEFLNRSECFLQIMSIYNLSAPVLSLLLPILILIFPFFIIKMKGMDVTMNEYILILKMLASNHAFGKLFTEWNSVELNQKIYLVVSALFYIFSIYQNFLLCIRFHMNMTKIHESIKKIKEYIQYTLIKINHYLSFSDPLASHGQFNRTLKEKSIQLSNLYDKLDKITSSPFSLFSISSWNQVFQIGYVLKTFYELYENDIYHDLMEYSFEFHTYTDCIEGLQENISNQQVNFAEFEKREKGKEKKKKEKESREKQKEKESREKQKEKESREKQKEKESREKQKEKDENASFKDNYYVVLKDRNPIKNDVSFDKNLILTGPNASGKTTVLKSILINIILTQQFGCGFYTAAYLKPYDYIHCYLNIPDTSGRDSLFQAEAKRCKEILDMIEENKEEERHFCAFDEIYSGTNPEEATLSTVAFIDYLVKYKNVSCILTSHFIKACKKLGKNKRVENYHMTVESNKSSIKYKYQIEKGISTIQGGIQILKDMNYPQKILDQTDSGFVNSKI